jgi:hypothetical protein
MDKQQLILKLYMFINGLLFLGVLVAILVRCL